MKMNKVNNMNQSMTLTLSTFKLVKITKLYVKLLLRTEIYIIHLTNIVIKTFK